MKNRRTEIWFEKGVPAWYLRYKGTIMPKPFSSEMEAQQALQRIRFLYEGGNDPNEESKEERRLENKKKAREKYLESDGRKRRER